MRIAVVLLQVHRSPSRNRVCWKTLLCASFLCCWWHCSFLSELAQQDGALSRCVSQCCCCCFWCLDKCLRHLNQVCLLRRGHGVRAASGHRLLGQGLASFSVKARLCKSFQVLGHLGLRHSYSALLPQQKSNRRQDVTGWAWVCSSRTYGHWNLNFIFCFCSPVSLL